MSNSNINLKPPEPPGNTLPPPHLWVDQFGSILYRYAILRIKDRHVAEELVQETFLAALKGRDRFKGNSSASTWLMGILKHKLLDYLRQHRSSAVPQESIGPDSVIDAMFTRDSHYRVKPWAEPKPPAQDADNADFWRVFAACLAGLPENYRRAFILTHHGRYRHGRGL